MTKKRGLVADADGASEADVSAPILSEPSLHSSLIETTHGNRHGSRTHQNPSALKRKAARAARFDPPSATVPSVPADANVSLPDGDPAPAEPSLASPAHTDQDLLDLTYQSAPIPIPPLAPPPPPIPMRHPSATSTAPRASLQIRAHSLPEWGSGLRAPPPNQIDERNCKGTNTCSCDGILVPGKTEVVRLIRPNIGRGSIQTSATVPDPDPEHREESPTESSLLGTHTCCDRSALRPPIQLFPRELYGDRPSYVPYGAQPTYAPDPDKPKKTIPLGTEVPPKRFRLLTAFQHLNEKGQWHKMCHCASQTDELCSTVFIQPITRIDWNSADWKHEENFYLDLTSRETWAEGEARAHFNSVRWERLLDLNPQTWADSAAFIHFESALPGLSKDSPFLPDCPAQQLTKMYFDDNFKDYSVSALPPPAERTLPSSTGPTYLSGSEKTLRVTAQGTLGKRARIVCTHVQVEHFVKSGVKPVRIESVEDASEEVSSRAHDSPMIVSQRTNELASAFIGHLQAVAAAENFETALSRRDEMAALRCGILPEEPGETTLPDKEEETLLDMTYGIFLPFAGSDDLQSQITVRRDELAALRRGILPEEPNLPPLCLPGKALRAARLYKAGHIRDPADLITPSDVDGRDFGLAHLTCLVEMKQRSHVDHMRASRAHPPKHVHPDYANSRNSELKHHHSKWLRGGTWARYPPPRVGNSELGSRRSATKFAHWCCDAAIAAPPSRTFVPLTTGPHRFIGSFLQCLTQHDHDDPAHQCRSSCPPPRPYLDRVTRQPYHPDHLSDSCYDKMQKLLRAVQKEADAFDVLRLTNPMYAVTLKGRREWLGKITTCLSSVSGLGRTYVAPRASRAIMTSFGPIDPSEWHNQTWGDVRDIMVDAGGHLTDLFPPDTLRQRDCSTASIPPRTPSHAHLHSVQQPAAGYFRPAGCSAGWYY